MTQDDVILALYAPCKVQKQPEQNDHDLGPDLNLTMTGQRSKVSFTTVVFIRAVHAVLPPITHQRSINAAKHSAGKLALHAKHSG